MPFLSARSISAAPPLPTTGSGLQLSRLIAAMRVSERDALLGELRLPGETPRKGLSGFELCGERTIVSAMVIVPVSVTQPLEMVSPRSLSSFFYRRTFPAI